MTPEQVSIAAKLWSEGCNTFDIANSLGLREATVFRWIDVIKSRSRLRAPITATA